MEFRVNKIEMDVRQRINEERSSDKVHSKKQIQVNKDRDSEKEAIDDSYKKKSGDSQKEHKEEKKEASGNTESEEKRDESKGQDPYRGHFIDIKR